MNFDKVIENRASRQRYSTKTVKPENVLDAIESASRAPSPGNLNFLKYLIVDDKEKIAKISQACMQPFVNDATILVVVCSDSNSVDIMFDDKSDIYVRHHVGASVENFLLKITDMKMASCWVGAFSEITIKKVLGIPDNINVEVVLPVGYPSKLKKEEQKSKGKMTGLIFYNEWKNKEFKKIRMIGSH